MKTAFENILDLMREQGSLDNEVGVRIAKVKSNSGVISIAEGVEIETDDYYIEEGLKERGLSKNDLVIVKRLSPEKYVVIGKVVKADD